MANLTIFSARTGSHTFSEGQVWEEHDGPSYLGTFMNREGRRIPVLPRSRFWSRCKVSPKAYQMGAFDLTNDHAHLHATMVEVVARFDANLERRIAALEEKANLDKAARAMEPLVRGAWMVSTRMGGWEHLTVHPSKEAALKAAQRPSETTEIWQGDFTTHRAGSVSSSGRRFLVLRLED